MRLKSVLLFLQLQELFFQKTFFSDSHLRKKGKGQDIKTTLCLSLVAKKNRILARNVHFLNNIFAI